MSNNRDLPIVIIAILLVAVILVAIATIPSTGTIRTLGIEVYSDPAATIPVASINWGSLNPGEVAQTTVWLKLTGNTDANVTMYTTNWVPQSASTYIHLSWTAEGLMHAGEIKQANITLEVARTIVGIESFTLDIVINATAR